MFRTLFFLRLECGQECVVALLELRGRKTYHAIMLEKKEERCRKTGEGTEGNRDLKRSRGRKDIRKKEKKVVRAKILTARYC